MLDKFLEKVQRFDIDKKNAEDIAEFCRFGFANGLSFGRIRKYGYTMETVSKLMDKNFRKATKNDIESLIIKLEQSEYTEHTKHDFKVAIKVFWRWLKKVENPKETQWIKSTRRKNRISLPKELFTEDDIKRMIGFSTNPRDKALIWVMYQTGCRIGEILGIKIKDIGFDEHSAIITVLGKTGSRRVRVFDNQNYLRFWLENHRFKDNKEAYLFNSISRNATTDQLDYHSVVDSLKTIAKKAGIKKPVNPHNFRHSRATELANHLTEAQMNQMFGWTQGSNMPSVYVHLSGRDLDEPLMKLNGNYAENQIKTEELAKTILENKELVKLIAQIVLKKEKKGG